MLGTCFLLVGLLGAFLPLLPTTPLVLLAAACFARSSERLHRALYESRLFGPSLREWRDHRSIALRSKILAVVLIVASFSVTIHFLSGRNFWQVGVAIVGVGLVLFFFTVPTARRDS